VFRQGPDAIRAADLGPKRLRSMRQCVTNRAILKSMCRARRMADKKKETDRLKARLPRGFADRGAAEIAATRQMIETIRQVYERYGFEAVETPAIEYTDALGKFLPDQDRPNEGVFSFQDDDEQWLSLRYDLTAPLARYVAENFDSLPKPYRSYRVGWVFRNEKPGPGRFRQFMQFDADTVGSASPAADAEMCMMAADTMEALGIKRGDYVVKVNNRKVLDGVLESMDITNDQQKLIVLRALDKLDRLGLNGVRALLGRGRKDESGDYTKGAELGEYAIGHLVQYVSAAAGDAKELASRIETAIKVAVGSGDDLYRLLKQIERKPLPSLLEEEPSTLSEQQINFLLGYSNSKYVTALGTETGHPMLGWTINFHQWRSIVGNSKIGLQGVDELEHLAEVLWAAGYEYDRIDFNPSVVRGLEYYTGPVFEVELTFSTDGKDGSPRFGSVGGGGRYDGLVSRFRGEPVPATGFSIGVSRLAAALQYLGKLDSKPGQGPVVVTVFDRERIADYQRMVKTLRDDGIRAELYLGSSGFNAQMRYADRRNAPCVVIQGSDEKAKGEVTIKDLVVGAELAKQEKEREQHLQKQAEAQFAVAEDRLVEAVRKVLARHGALAR
jgi:histidyl-tRNA synthetase